MPINSQGGLVVSLGLDATEYTQGLTKAEFEAKKFATSFERGIQSIGTGLKALGIGLVVNEIYQMGKAVISAAADLKGLSDSTGSSVENLSKLKNQAEIAGTSFESLQSLLNKLAVGMGSTGEKSTKVIKALQLLGVSANDPAEALQEVAKALAKYEDGAAKAALANDLFGKGGAAFLGTLKDIAQLGDVAGTVTTRQAEEAQKLEQAYRRMGVEATTFKNIILSDLVPALNTMLTQMTEGIRIAGGFASALLNFGTINPFNTLRENLKDTDERIKNVLAGSGSAEARWAQALGVTDSLLTKLKQRREFLLMQEREQAMAGAAALGDAGDQVSRRFQRLQKLPAPAGGGAGGARVPKDRISDAQRYLDSLEQQLQKTQELTTVERILADVESGRLKLSADVPLQRILAIGELIDAAKEQERIQREAAKLAADEARTREQTSRLQQQSIKQARDETIAMAQSNQQMKEEIELIGKDEAQIAAIVQRRLDDAIAAKEQALAIAQNTEGMKAEADQIQDQIRLLQERKGLLVEKGQREQIAKQQREAAEEAKRFNDIFVESFADAAASVATHTQSIGDAVKAMERTIVDAFTRIAAKKLAEQIFGSVLGGGSGGGNFLGTLMQSLLGGSSGMPAFAVGGTPPVGTPVIVGERGPELFVPKTTGTIIPNSELVSRRAGRSINVSVNVLPGASRRTAEQAALRMGAEIQRAMNEIG